MIWRVTSSRLRKAARTRSVCVSVQYLGSMMNGSQRSILKANTSMCIRCIVRSIADDSSSGLQKVCIILVSSYPHNTGAPHRFYLL